MTTAIIIGIVVILFMGLRTVQQGNVSVITIFGKYQRVIRPGLNFIIPFVETVFKKYQRKIAQLS